MTAPAPISHPYNLARLGHAGDQVRFEADATQREAIQRLADLTALARFSVTVALRKTTPDRFVLDYRVEADAAQACVVTLAPVPASIDHAFRRELHFTGTGRPGQIESPTDVELSPLEEDEPEVIENLHYELAAPALEEFLLALDPYPRCPGVEFDPGPDAALKPESPFAALKSLKSST